MESPKSDNKDANRIQRREAENRRAMSFLSETWGTFIVLKRWNGGAYSSTRQPADACNDFSPKGGRLRPDLCGPGTFGRRRLPSPLRLFGFFRGEKGDEDIRSGPPECFFCPATDVPMADGAPVSAPALGLGWGT